MGGSCTYVELYAFKIMLDGSLEIFQAIFGAKIASSVGHHNCL